MESTFSEFGEFMEPDKSLKHEFGLNLEVLSTTCVLLGL